MKKFLSKIRGKYLLLILSAVLCGLLQSSLSIPILGFAAFAPMMLAIQKADGKTEFIKAFLSFFPPYYFTQVIFLFAVYKSAPMPVIASLPLLFLASIALTVWLSLITLLPLYLLRWLKRSPYTDMAVIALLICGGEWIAEHTPFLSFPWSGAWLTVTGSPVLMQGANLLGCRFVSFLVLLTNGLLAQLITCKGRVKTALILAAVTAANISYGYYSVRKIESQSYENKIKVMCVQDEAEGADKNRIPPIDAAVSYLEIMDKNYTDDISLIILPETPLLEGYDESKQEFSMLADFAREHNCTVISGCFLREEKSYNSQYAIYPDGSVSNFYCKQVLVPFGEHNPIAFLTGEHTLSSCGDKEKIQPIDCKDFSLGCGICIESIYSDILKAHAKNGADVLCVSTNDSWFGKSGARVQHYRHCMMRAAENGKYLVRAGNCGISSVISPAGKVIAENASREKGIVISEISPIKEKTFYSRTGDIFITLPALLAVWAVIRRFTAKSKK